MMFFVNKHIFQACLISLVDIGLVKIRFAGIYLAVAFSAIAIRPGPAIVVRSYSVCSCIITRILIIQTSVIICIFTGIEQTIEVQVLGVPPPVSFASVRIGYSRLPSRRSRSSRRIRTG